MTLFDSEGNRILPYASLHDNPVYFGDTIYMYPYYDASETDVTFIKVILGSNSVTVDEVYFADLTPSPKPGGGTWYAWTIPSEYMSLLCPNSEISSIVAWTIEYRKSGQTGRAGSVASCYLTVPASVKPTLKCVARFICRRCQ